MNGQVLFVMHAYILHDCYMCTLVVIKLLRVTLYTPARLNV